MIVPEQKPLFRQKRNGNSPYRMVLWMVLCLACVFVLREIQTGQVEPLFMPTHVPTRTSNSFAQEGNAHFTSGNLNLAIDAYKKAVELEPNNSELWAELARIQGYSSTLLTTDVERRKRMAEALESINKAVKINPEDSTASATRAFVLDWSAGQAADDATRQSFLTEGEQEAVRALQLDNQNTMALAYYAEILVDEQKWLQADQMITQAMERDSSTMDVRRVNAYVKESLGLYSDAITEYEAAAKITPNLTFLYIYAGANLRQLKQYDRALEYFAMAARINANLGIKDPIPYLSISKTYSQMGEFFPASLNVKKALVFNPDSPDIYGQLGVVYFKSKNYEGSIAPFKCALFGCNAEESCAVRDCDPEKDPKIVIQGMPLSPATVVYYYTYGSVLAGLHRKSNPMCDESLRVLGMVRDKFSSDPLIMQIIAPSEEICASYGYKR
jgi:tetratricopeptide (TPR) repeat protein